VVTILASGILVVTTSRPPGPAPAAMPVAISPLKTPAPIVTPQFTLTPEVAERAKEAVDYLHDVRNVPRAQGAGITGDLVPEAGINPNEVQNDGRSRGLAQWFKDRWAAFVKFARDHNRPITCNPVRLTPCAHAQLDFILYEMRQPPMAEVNKQLSAATTPEDAAVAFIGYLKPAPQFLNLEQRREYAAAIAKL
jgi:hypothetical protein